VPVSSLADRINSLKARASEAAAQVTSLTAQRKSFALAATEGDARARKSLSDAEFQLDALRKEEQTTADAIEVGEALLKQQELDAEAAERCEREVEAHKAAQAVIALNEEIDLALKQLREIFERRASLLAGLANTGLVDSLFVARLANRSGPTRAACAAGLAKYLALETVAPQSQLPLADTNAVLLGIGRPSRESPQPRTPKAGEQR
jgi:hypothetical protein